MIEILKVELDKDLVLTIIELF